MCYKFLGLRNYIYLMSLAIQIFLKKLIVKVWEVGFDKGKSFFKPFLYFILLYPLFYFIYTTGGKIGQCTNTQSKIFVISHYFPFSSSIDYFEKIQKTCFENNFLLSRIFFSFIQSTSSLALLLMMIFALLSIFFSHKKFQFKRQTKNYKLNKRLLNIGVDGEYHSFDLDQKIIEFVGTDFYKEQQPYQKTLKSVYQQEDSYGENIVKQNLKKEQKESQEITTKNTIEYWDYKTLAIKNQIENYIEKNSPSPQFKFSTDYPFLKIDNGFLEQDFFKNQCIIKNFKGKEPKTISKEEENFGDNTLKEMGVKKQKKYKLEENSNTSIIGDEKMVNRVEKNVLFIDLKKEKILQDIFQTENKKEIAKEEINRKDIENKEGVAKEEINKKDIEEEIGDIFSIDLDNEQIKVENKKEVGKDVFIGKVEKINNSRS